MRKAFDANVTRAKPRLRVGTAGFAIEQPPEEVFPPPPIEVPSLTRAAESHPSDQAERPALRAAEPQVPVAGGPAPSAAESPRLAEARVTSSPAIVRRALEPAQRRERLKERLKAASAKVEPAQPTPQSPAEARASALSLIAQLRQELEDSRKLASSLSHDLAEARAELARASEEGRSRSEEAGRLAGEVAARAKLIEELGQEMACLEAERDDVLLELRAERKEAEVLQATKADLERQLGRREAELSEALSEEERLVGELESNALELKRAQSALGSLTEERDQLAHQVGELTREHEELRDSQKALDEIHRALASARIRVQGTVGNL